MCELNNSRKLKKYSQNDEKNVINNDKMLNIILLSVIIILLYIITNIMYFGGE
ncbi:MAG: hypothetical protein K0S01_934 [Herbinix sp.]|jgi:hypothetical protein|nr:hypothetical protein [Herbinix sp.]